MPLPEDILAALHSRLEKLEAGYAQRLTEAYRMVLGRLVPEAEAFAAQMQARIEAGQALTANQVRQLRRYKAFIAQAQAEMTRYAAVVENEVATGQVVFARQGLADAITMVQASLPEAVRASIMATFAVMPTDAIDAMVAALAETSPLRTRTLARFGEEAARGIGEALVYGVASGRGPRETAREMANAWGAPLTDALRISRTEHVRAHRLATMDSYRRNPHVVRGWIWQSALIPGRTCAACVAMSGTHHDLTETLDDHPNGLCTMIPETVTWEELGFTGIPETGAQVEDGSAWFARQPESVQREMLGPGHYEAYLAGTPIGDMVAWRSDPEWGRSVGVKPLKEINNAIVARPTQPEAALPEVPRFTSATEAESWIKQHLGVETNLAKASVYQRQWTASGLREARVRGLGLPDGLRFGSLGEFRKIYGQQGDIVSGYYDKDTKTVVLNRTAIPTTEERMISFRSRLFKQGQSSSDNQYHTILHELAHHEHWMRTLENHQDDGLASFRFGASTITRQWETEAGLAEMIAKHVSRGALISTAECIAEARVAQILGRSLPAPIPELITIWENR